MSFINSQNKFNKKQKYEYVNETNTFNIPVNDISIRNEKDSTINDINYSLKLNNGKLLSSLDPKQNLLTYPNFINKLKKSNVSKPLMNFRNAYRKIRILINWINILFCLTLTLYFISKLLNYRNQIIPTGVAVKKINFGFSKHNTFLLRIKGIPLAQKDKTFDISNIALSINPLNTKNCWYKFTSDSVKTICTNTKETELCFTGAINPIHSLSKISNQIKLKGCNIILQSKIHVTNFWVFRSTYTLTKKYSFNMEASQKNNSGNELFYILNKSLRGEEVLFSKIEAEHLNIFDYLISTDRKINMGVVTPNMYFQGLKAFRFEIPNLEFIYKGTKVNETNGEIKRIVLNHVKMIDGKLLPFKLSADDLPNCHKLSIENLYSKLWVENEDIRLLNVLISGFSIFEDNVHLKQKVENEIKIDSEEVNIIDIKEISPENINFTLSLLRTWPSPFIKHVDLNGNVGVLKIMSLDEQPLLLFNMNYTIQTENNLKNRQIGIQISDINWQLTLKGLKNGEDVQIVDSYDQYISHFSLKTCSFIRDGMKNENNKKGNEYKVNSWIQNMNSDFFEISCIVNSLIKNEELMKQKIQIHFLEDTEIKLVNDQFNITCLVEKQSLVKQVNVDSFDNDFRFKISVFPITSFIGFAKLDNLFLFKLPNGREIDLQNLSPRVMDNNDVIGLFNYLSLDYSESSVAVNIKETIFVEEPKTPLEALGSVHWMLYFPANYEIYMPLKIISFGVKIKSPNLIHICYTANRTLYKTFRVPISLENFVIEYDTDALKDTFFIFLNPYLYELKLNESLRNKEVTLHEYEVDTLFNLGNQETLAKKERQSLLNELSYNKKKYNKLEELIEYKIKPKAYFKFWEKERNSVFGITATFESSSNINSLLKEIEKSIFLLNSHEYFSKSFSGNLHGKVFKKFKKLLPLLFNSTFKKIKINIKSIEVNSKDGEPILKLYVLDNSFNRFELEKFEISIEVYLKGISTFLKKDFLFEILVEDGENKKITFINYDMSKSIFNNLLILIKEKMNTHSSTNPNENAFIESRTYITDEDPFISKSVVSLLNHINNFPHFNLFHTECEIYVELFYENIFKFILFNQEEGKPLLETKIIKQNLDLLLGRFLSKFLFYYEYVRPNTKSSNSNTILNFISSLISDRFESFLNSYFWDIAKKISNIETIKKEYEVYQKIKIKQTFSKFKTEIMYGTPLNGINYESKKCFSFIYKNIILNFYINFQTNILKNIKITFEVSTDTLGNSNFNDNNYIFKRLLSLYEKLYIKIKENNKYTENDEEIVLNISQVLEFYDSCLTHVIKLGFEKAKEYISEGSYQCYSLLQKCLQNGIQWFVDIFK